MDGPPLLNPEEYLPDPCNDRVMKNVRPPPHKPLSTRRAFPNGVMDPEVIKNWIKVGGTLSKSCIISVILWAKEKFETEPNILRVNGNVAIIGDIHGQLYDMFYMLKKIYSN